MMQWLENYIKYQTTEIVSVKPVANWSDRDGKFYINSIAGLLVYKPKTLRDLTRFRNEWINRFNQCVSEKELFEFYADIRSKEKIKYVANLRTRLKSVKWTFKG